MLESMTKQDSQHCGIIGVSRYNQDKITWGVGGMKKLAVLAVAGLISATASAVNWVVADYNQTMSMYVDLDSISRSGQYKKAFFMMKSNTPLRLDNGAYFDSYTSYQFIDCKSNPLRMKLDSIVFRYNSNVVLQQSGLSKLGIDWQIAHPSTLGHSASRLVCSR